MGVAHGLQLLHRGGRCAAADVHTVLLHQGDILFDGLIGDAEGGNHMTGHAAQAALPLENGGFNPGAAQEVGGGNTGRTAADDGGLLAGDPLRNTDGGHQSVVALFGGQQLGVTDADGLVIEVPGALGLTPVGADGAGQEGQGILLGDELQGRGVQALAAQLHILGNVLLNGAAALTGGGEAVQPGDAFLTLAAG